jgi:hypothetical protein
MNAHGILWMVVLLLTIANIYIARRRDTAPSRACIVMSVHQWVHGNLFMLAAMEISYLRIPLYDTFCIIQILAYPLFCHWIFRNEREREKS